MLPIQCFSLFLVLQVVVCETDFYELLGVERNANNREIRKAFKILALKIHPDKNKDDPDAHDKFVGINRAFQVLKDEELRKKYDQYGEKGLADDFRGGNRYESWKFYQQNFGIYDDDVEIITLSRSDFELSVENTDDIWFINYYSYHCSHCHDFAPLWRELALELEGVIRIGAVNCGDDRALCQQQGIRSYPSLLIYPGRKEYEGVRSLKQMLDFALGKLTVKPTILTSVNFEPLTSSPGIPWVITYCSAEYGGDCLDTKACLKLSAILESLVNVGSINCDKHYHLCEKLGADSGRTVFFSSTPVGHVKEGTVIDSLTPKEIALAILHQLPEVTELNSTDYENVKEELVQGKSMPWLLHFVNGETTQIELKKLPALLADDINVGKIDCRSGNPACEEMHIHKFPRFVVLKPGGSFEVHHGREGAHDIAAFVRESSTSSVQVLSPDDFPDRVQYSKDLWFVDYFAPWCPPCMKLLPEFRKASKLVDISVNFGTVDCTVHSNLCNSLNIRSYPSAILYNNSIPHRFQGNHDASSIVEFIKDILDPPVMVLTQTDFEMHVAAKSSKELWLVDYYTTWCPPCMQMLPEWRKFARMVKGKKNVFVASVDCEIEAEVCRSQGIKSYPTVRLYKLGSKGTSSALQFQGWMRNAANFMAWAQDYLSSTVTVFTAQSFEREVLYSKKAWVVDFYASWCMPCQQFSPQFEKAAEALEKHGVKLGKVDCHIYKRFCREAHIPSYPTLRLYQGSTSSRSKQDIMGESLAFTGSAQTVIEEVMRKLSLPNSKAPQHVKDEL